METRVLRIGKDRLCQRYWVFISSHLPELIYIYILKRNLEVTKILLNMILHFFPLLNIYRFTY
jgi:hypothetical protein